MGSFGRPACLLALDVVEREGKGETGDGHPGQNEPDSRSQQLTRGSAGL